MTEHVRFLRTSAARLREIADAFPSSPLSPELRRMADELDRDADRFERDRSDTVKP